MTRRKNSVQVQVNLRDSSPIEKLIGEIYEEDTPQKIGYEWVSGTEFIRKLILLGYDRIQNEQGQSTAPSAVPPSSEPKQTPPQFPQIDYGTNPL